MLYHNNKFIETQSNPGTRKTGVNLTQSKHLKRHLQKSKKNDITNHIHIERKNQIAQTIIRQ